MACHSLKHSCFVWCLDQICRCRLPAIVQAAPDAPCRCSPLIAWHGMAGAHHSSREVSARHRVGLVPTRQPLERVWVREGSRGDAGQEHRPVFRRTQLWHIDMRRAQRHHTPHRRTMCTHVHARCAGLSSRACLRTARCTHGTACHLAPHWLFTSSLKCICATPDWGAGDPGMGHRIPPMEVTPCPGCTGVWLASHITCVSCPPPAAPLRPR